MVDSEKAPRVAVADEIEELRYIAELSFQLRKMAKARNNSVLTYLLEMVYLEASDGLKDRPDSDVNEAAQVA